MHALFHKPHKLDWLYLEVIADNNIVCQIIKIA